MKRFLTKILCKVFGHSYITYINWNRDEDSHGVNYVAYMSKECRLCSHTQMEVSGVWIDLEQFKKLFPAINVNFQHKSRDVLEYFKTYDKRHCIIDDI